MGAIDSGRLVSAVLDPVLTPAGFRKGQYGEGGTGREGDTQIIFCAGHDDFSDRYPRLPQANQQEPGGACVDLVVEVRADGTLGRVQLEGTSLEETLRHMGLPAEGDAVAASDGHPITESLPVIAAALQRLLGRV